jgi:hypothetical protein
MCIAMMTNNLGSDHTMRRILIFINRATGNRFIKAWPTTTTIIFRIGRELICAELAGDFHLGYARQLTDKSSLLFDLAF